MVIDVQTGESHQQCPSRVRKYGQSSSVHARILGLHFKCFMRVDTLLFPFMRQVECYLLNQVAKRITLIACMSESCCPADLRYPNRDASFTQFHLVQNQYSLKQFTFLRVFIPFCYFVVLTQYLGNKNISLIDCDYFVTNQKKYSMDTKS